MQGLVAGEQSQKPKQELVPGEQALRVRHGTRAYLSRQAGDWRWHQACGPTAGPALLGVLVGCPFTSGPQFPSPSCLPPAHQEDPREMGGKLEEDEAWGSPRQA